MKILHLADIHCRDVDIEEISMCLGYIQGVADQEEPDLIVIAGDLTDSQNLKADSKTMRVLFETVSDLADIASVAIVTGTPSHEGHIPELFENIVSNHMVWVSTYPEQVALIGNAFCPIAEVSEHDPLTATLTMIPTITKQYFQSQSSIGDTDKAIAGQVAAMLGGFGVTAAEYKVPHLLVGHFQVGGAMISETQQLIGNDIEISREQLGMAQADLCLLGHIHLAQKIEPNIFYSGSITRLNWGEMEAKGIYIHNLRTDMGNPNKDEWSLESRFIETPARKLLKLDADFTKTPIEELDVVLYTYSKEDLEGALVRAEFKVWQNEANKIDQKAIREMLMSGEAKDVDVRIIRIPRANVRSQRFFELKTLEEKLIEQAKIKDEKPLSSGILAKAVELESKNSDQLYKNLI